MARTEPAFSVGSYVGGWRSRARGTRAGAAARGVEARLDELVARLVREFGATHIVLFGSFARGTPTERNDVDLLVHGLSPERRLDASVVADRVLVDIHADLVQASIARAEIRERAEAEGQVLHG